MAFTERERQPATVGQHDAAYLPQPMIDAWMAALERNENGDVEAHTKVSLDTSGARADIIRLGQYLVDHKLISLIDLQDALDLQRVCGLDGERVLLGEALVRMGAIKRETLEAAVESLIADLKHDARTAGEQRTLYQRAISRLSTAARRRTSRGSRVGKASRRSY